jgi:hypothetical protein
MLRRRRPKREVAFSFDSFLDVVANVVGIILKLILVAWAGARTYKAADIDLVALVAKKPAISKSIDPRISLLARQKEELEASQKALAGKVTRRDEFLSIASRLRHDVEALSLRCRDMQELAGVAVKDAVGEAKTVQAVVLTRKELLARAAALQLAAVEVKKLPPTRKEFQYRTPVSATIQSYEMMFECKAGRVTLIDTQALVAIMRHDSKSQVDQLRNRWSVSATTRAVGPFRLRYTLERERSLLSGPANAVPVDGNFRYFQSSWEVEPVALDRGEAADKALVAGSDFRKVIDTVDAKKTAVTLWVYPDSFVLYRQLRDYLHDHDIVVAGRPMPEGLLIATSSQGTISRGQ